MNSKGFTLIELVVVIVILGILAATAVPKFVNLSAEAKTATLQGVKASMQSAAAMIYSKSLVKGNQNELDSTIDLGDGAGFGSDGKFFITYGYPLANISEWKRIIEVDSAFSYKSFGSSSLNVLVIYRNDSVEPTGAGSPCMLYYLEPTTPNTAPQFIINECA